MKPVKFKLCNQIIDFNFAVGGLVEDHPACELGWIFEAQGWGNCGGKR
jgi:hypothetical protein